MSASSGATIFVFDDSGQKRLFVNLNELITHLNYNIIDLRSFATLTALVAWRLIKKIPRESHRFMQFEKQFVTAFWVVYL